MTETTERKTRIESSREVPPRDEQHELHATRSAEEQNLPIHEAYDDLNWTPPTQNLAPDPLSGMAQRWIRVKINGMDDPQNVALSIQEGWRPRPADTVSQDLFFPVISFGQWGNVISNSDSVLMHRPIKMNEGYKRHYAAQTERYVQGIKTYVKDNMPAGHGTTGGRVSEFSIKPTRISRVAED